MRRTTHAAAFTLVEVIITIAVLSIVSLGAMGYQYHAVQRSKIGEAKMDAARLGSLLLESWKSCGGSLTFDPTTLNIGIGELENSNQYKVKINGIPFYISLITDVIDTNEITGVTLRQLSVFVQWNPDYAERAPESSAPGTTFHTYVRQDQSGG